MSIERRPTTQGILWHNWPDYRGVFSFLIRPADRSHPTPSLVIPGMSGMLKLGVLIRILRCGPDDPSSHVYAAATVVIS